MARKVSAARLSTEEVAHYEKTRYSGNQKLVDRIEQKIVRELLGMAVGKMDKAAVSALDVPSGYGRFTPALLESCGSLTSFDASASMAGRARDQARALGAIDPKAGVTDIRALPFADRSFDVVLSMRLLHHFHEREDREPMFRELHRVTREHLVISYYDSTPAHRLQRKIAGIFSKKRRNSRIFFFGADRFRDEAEKAGLRIVAERAPLPMLHAQRIALLRRA